MDMRVFMFARFEAAPGKTEELRDRLLEMVYLTHQETGFDHYELQVDMYDENKFYISEIWHDQAAIDFHMKLPHVQAILRDSKELTTTGVDITFMHRHDQNWAK